MIAVYVMLGILGGMGLAAVLAVFWFLFREIRALRQLLEQLGAGQIGTVLAYLPELVAVMKLLVQQNAELTGALGTFGMATGPAAPSPAAQEAAEIGARRNREADQPQPLSEREDDERTANDAAGEAEPLY